MAEGEEESLESLLTKATSPLLRQEDPELAMAFCEQVNKELEGPQISVRLLAHKIQSPQEREALYALTVLEACVKNCGKRFHQEIGKFRFLNELIKVVSPKYLGSKTSEKVKKRCIEIIYSWTKGLKHESKIEEAYEMLKRQGIVKEDPVLVDQTFIPPPPPREKNSIFDEEEKSKLLSRLLKSKHPEDLQAANRLIKNMVKQDAERIEKVSKRVTELETVNNNLKLLSEMLAHYDPNTATESDKEVMKELYDTLEKHRPNLFRLASDTDDKDNEGLSEILKSNDNVVKVMGQYKRLVEDSGEEVGLIDSTQAGAPLVKAPVGNGLGASALLDLNFDSSSGSPSKPAVAEGSSVLDDQLAALGINNSAPATTAPAATQGGDLHELGDLFSPGVATASPQPVVSGPGFTPAFPVNFNQQQPGMPTQPLMAQGMVPQPGITPQSMAPQPMVAQPLRPGIAPHTRPAFPQQTTGATGGGGVFSGLTPQTTGVAPLSQQQASPTPGQQKAMNDLDMLGKAMLQQSMAGKPAAVVPPPSKPQKIPMNQINSSGTPATPPAAVAAPSSGDAFSLTDVFVPLESIQPGTNAPITAYDKNGVKVILHFAKDSPRPDITVMVVSVMSTNTSPVAGFVFQAAVPKSMKVKLQPPSATDLPAYNPILPPSAITQIMLLANPQKEKVRLKFKITFTLNDTPITDVGDLSNFPV